MRRTDMTRCSYRKIAAQALAVTALLWMGMLPLQAQAAEEKKRGPATTHELLMKAHGQLHIATHYAELAVAPHQPGVGWHKANTQRAINIIVGADNQDFSKDVENPGDGHGVIKYLQEAHDAMKGCSPVNTCEAIESSLDYLRAAVEHGKQSIGLSRMAGMELREGRLFGALLRAAHGTRDSASATVGALDYAIHVTEHMHAHE